MTVIYVRASYGAGIRRIYLENLTLSSPRITKKLAMLNLSGAGLLGDLKMKRPSLTKQANNCIKKACDRGSAVAVATWE